MKSSLRSGKVCYNTNVMKWAQKNKNTILWALTIVVIILIIIFSKPGNNTNEEAIINENGEEVSVDGENQTPETVATEDGNTYDFSGVQWEFDTTDPSVPAGQTWLKMRFADFTRNGRAINLRNPYKLGFHPGTCTESEFVDTTMEEGIPLSYVVCQNETTTREFVVLQEMNRVVVKYTDAVDGTQNPQFSELYSIDLTTIVQ